MEPHLGCDYRCMKGLVKPFNCICNIFKLDMALCVCACVRACVRA